MILNLGKAVYFLSAAHLSLLTLTTINLGKHLAQKMPDTFESLVTKPLAAKR